MNVKCAHISGVSWAVFIFVLLSSFLSLSRLHRISVHPWAFAFAISIWKTISYRHEKFMKLIRFKLGSGWIYHFLEPIHCDSFEENENRWINFGVDDII